MSDLVETRYSGLNSDEMVFAARQFLAESTGFVGVNRHREMVIELLQRFEDAIETVEAQQDEFDEERDTILSELDRVRGMVKPRAGRVEIVGAPSIPGVYGQSERRADRRNGIECAIVMAGGQLRSTEQHPIWPVGA